MMEDFTCNTGLVDSFVFESRRLIKLQITHIISDLDDTLCSRRAQMRNEPLLKENRGEAWNAIVFNEIWAHDFILEHYEWIGIPQDILTKMDENNSLILTAGIRILQELKIRSLWLDYLNYTVVPHGEDKILETIYHILFDLKYIPEIIEVYEDRPHYFLKYRDLIETCLWTKLKVFLVEMNGNQWYKKIEELSSQENLKNCKT